MAAQKKVKLDLNIPEFQDSWLKLEKEERSRVVDTFVKVSQMDWSQIYRDNGLNWEKITSVNAPEGIEAIYSIRITQSTRAIVCRQEDYMRFLFISADHDATYGKK